VIRATIAVVADVGYSAATVKEIVGRARVSRKAFYALFESKQACFLAAIDVGQDSLLPEVLLAAQAADVGGWQDQLRVLVRGFLRACASEPEYTWAWVVELPAAGPEGIRKRIEFLELLATSLRQVHADASSAGPLPLDTYITLAGGGHELIYRYVSEGKVADLPELEDQIVEYLRGILK